VTSPSPDPPTPEAGEGSAQRQPSAAGSWELPSATDIEKYDLLLGGGAAERALSLVERRFALEVEDQYQRRLDAEHRRRLDMINVGFRLAGVLVGASGFAGCLWARVPEHHADRARGVEVGWGRPTVARGPWLVTRPTHSWPMSDDWLM